MKEINLTQSFKQDLEGTIGKITFADTDNAKALYELFKEHPDWFTFEVSYTVNADGSKQLNEVSLVSRHTKRERR